MPEVEEQPEQEREQVEKWEQASSNDQGEQEEEEEDEEEGGREEGGGGVDGGGMGDGPPDGPVDFTIKSEQMAAISPAEEANEMAAFLASAVRTAAQFQVTAHFDADPEPGPGSDFFIFENPYP